MFKFLKENITDNVEAIHRGASRHTERYGFPIFSNYDIPTWIEDYNQQSYCFEQAFAELNDKLDAIIKRKEG